MRIEIHHYHHFGADDLQICLQIRNQLNQLSEKLNFMSENTATRQQLDDAIGNLANVVSNGFDELGGVVKSELTEVASALEAKSGSREDLSNEVARINQLGETIAAGFAEAKSAVEQIVSVSSAEPVAETTGLSEENTEDLPTEEFPSDPATEEFSSSPDATGDSSDEVTKPEESNG